MECNNTHCTWNGFGQCCPEDEKQYNNAIPNTLDCPSSLRADHQQQLKELYMECSGMLFRRNMKELLEIRELMKSQRSD